MSTDAIRSRFGGLGTYLGSSAEDLAGLRRAPDLRAPLATQSAEMRISAGSASGRLSLAQGVQLGVAVAQAGVAASQFLAARPAGLAQAAAPAPGEPGRGAADAGRRSRGGTVPAELAEMLAQAPEAANASQASGSDLQAWLDIATGRAALQAVQEMRGRDQMTREKPQSQAESAERMPEVEVSAERQPDSPLAAMQAPEETQAREPVTTGPADPPARPPAPEEPPRRAALEQARRSFGAALERLDAQLEPALAEAVTRLGGAEPSEVAASSAMRMRQEPARAVAGHTGGSGLPGILGLLRWDLTPLSEPLPDAAPGRG